MRLAFLTAVTMLAFAGNSILNRLALASGSIDAASFAVLRVAAGAIVLWILVMSRATPKPAKSRRRWIGAASLFVYMIGFSMAYLTLDAGLGAIILFGTVQMTMFGWTAATRGSPAARQVLGAAGAFAGLTLALWPEAGAAVDLGGGALMVLAGLGWGAYTLAGRGASDPLAETGANFAWCLPLTCVLLLLGGLHVSPYGAALAIVAGAITSGLGYALWYTVLPALSVQTAAVVQLSVPLIAVAGGALLLGETLGPKVLLAAVLVTGGIAVTVTAQPARADRN